MSNFGVALAGWPFRRKRMPCRRSLFTVRMLQSKMEMKRHDPANSTKFLSQDLDGMLLQKPFMVRHCTYYLIDKSRRRKAKTNCCMRAYRDSLSLATLHQKPEYPIWCSSQLSRCGTQLFIFWTLQTTARCWLSHFAMCIATCGQFLRIQTPIFFSFSTALSFSV